MLLSLLYIPHIILYLKSDRRNYIKEDIKVNLSNNNYPALGGSIVSLVQMLSNNKYYRNLFYYRIGTKAKVVSWYCRPVPFFIISGEIGPGFYVAHPYSTTIFARRIGCNFTCHQNTTIGVKYDLDNTSIPSIGDNVVVGANVCIIGDISIGNDVTIGAGSVVTKDVPNGCVIAGNPAIIIKRNLV